MYSWKASRVGNPSQNIPQSWKILILAGGYKEIELQLPDSEQALGLMSSPLQDITPNRQTFVSPLKFLNAKANLEMFSPNFPVTVISYCHCMKQLLILNLISERQIEAKASNSQLFE